MRELYRRYFYIPKNGRIHEKTMLVRVAFMATVMLLCLAAMSFTAYAYFSHSITSSSNMIKSADFDVTVTVTKDSEPIETDEKGVYNLAVGTYTVLLEKAGSASTGFCVVQIGSDVYHTQQLGADGNEQRTTLTFTLSLTEETEVTFTPHWGTSSYYDDYRESTENSVFYIVDGVTVPAQSNSDEKG